MKSRTLLALALIGLVSLAGPGPALADRGIEAFYGEYTGQTISDAGTGLSQRDLAVSIQPHKKGFKIDWTTVIPKAGGKVSRKSYSIVFHPTKREYVFRSLMGKDMFGNMAPLDPMKGEPYVWARIQGDTFSVFALLVTDDGGYEMQAYHRTRIPDGLRLRFTRQRENRTMKVIEGVLKRMAD